MVCKAKDFYKLVYAQFYAQYLPENVHEFVKIDYFGRVEREFTKLCTISAKICA